MSEPSARNHLIDVARVASVAVVVIFHCLLYQIAVEDGRPAIVPWGPGVGWWIASWFFMIIPVFFIAGGFAHAVVIGRLPDLIGGYPAYLAQRGRRLVGPLVVFVGFATVVSTAGAWLVNPARSIELSRQFSQLLWFVTTYLVIVAVAPLLCWAQRRYAWLVLAALLVAAAGVDAWSFRVGNPDLRYWNLLTIWPLCHQLGIGYHDGWFRRGPVWQPVVAVGVGVIAILGLVFGLGYPPSAVGLADLPIANVQPPTLAMAALGLAQAGVLGLAQRAGVLRTLSSTVSRALGVASALLMTAYLWHIPCILLAGGILFLASVALPAASGLLLSQVAVVLVTLVLVVALVPWIGRLEFRLIPPLGPAPEPVGTIAGFTVLSLGTCLVWLNGTTLHPAAPWSAVGLILLTVGALVLARAAGGQAPVLYHRQDRGGS